MNPPRGQMCRASGAICRTAVLTGRNGQFHVAVAQRLFTDAQRLNGVHGLAQCRAGPVGTNGQVEAGLVTLSLAVDHVKAAGVEIDRFQTSIKMNSDPGLLGCIKQGNVEMPPVNRPDDFVFALTVSL
jgi:hypothetical protein